MVREYHALRVNLTPKQVEKLETNHKTLSSYIETLKDQLSEGRLAVATVDNDGHGGPAHPSVSGTVSKYVNGVLSTIKNDTSLENVEHPWTKVRAKGSYAIAQAEAQALANLANARAGASSAPVDTRRKRRRKKNKVSSKEQMKILEDHTMKDDVPQTDLSQTYRDVNRNRSMLQDATKGFRPNKKAFKASLGRPSTAPPPKSPFATLQLLQHVLTYDLTAYKRLPPREIGPGHYDISAALPPPVKEPHKMSASFLSPSGRPSPSSSIGTGSNSYNSDNDGEGEGHTFGAPSTFSGRQKVIAKILKDQGVLGINRKPSPYDRLYKGERPPKSKFSRTLQATRRSHPLLGASGGNGSQSTPNLSKIGTSLWDDAFYQEMEGSGADGKHSGSPRRLAPLSPTPGGAPGAYGGAYLPYDKMDTFLRPTSPEFKFSSAKRFVAQTDPHWKGLGSPYDLKKDLSCWLKQSVYLDDRLPKDAGASKKLAEREEGPQPLSASFNSVAGNIKGSPINYKPSFDRSLPRFQKDRLLALAEENANRPLGGAEAELRWSSAQQSHANDPKRPSLAFITEGHPAPEDMSLVITMGSQFKKKKPRFRPSRSLKEELGVLYLDDNNDEDAVENNSGSDLKGKKSSGSSKRRKIPRSFVPEKNHTRRVLNRKKNMASAHSPMRKSTKKLATTARPSTTIAGSKSVGVLRATV